MSIFESITKEIHEGKILHAPVMNNPFEVKSVDDKEVVFFVRKTNIEVSKECWNGLPDFLMNKGWVLIGANHIASAKLDEGTLEKYLRYCTKAKSKHSQASYVASLLEYLKIVEVDHNRPSKVRWRT